MKELVLGKDHKEAGKVLHLYRSPRGVVAGSPDDLEFASLKWDEHYGKWEVRQGSYEQIPGGQLYFSDNLADAFYVLREYMGSIFPYKPVRPSLKALRGPQKSPD
jgi:hypothetical protein